jgi:hypothetical protein
VRDAHTRIRDANHDSFLTVPGLRFQFDRHPTIGRRKLDGVRHQIIDDLLQAACVSHDITRLRVEFHFQRDEFGLRIGYLQPRNGLN